MLHFLIIFFLPVTVYRSKYRKDRLLTDAVNPKIIKLQALTIIQMKQKRNVIEQKFLSVCVSIIPGRAPQFGTP